MMLRPQKGHQYLADAIHPGLPDSYHTRPKGHPDLSRLFDSIS